MEPIYDQDQRGVLLDLFATACVARFKLQQLEDSLSEDADSSSTIFQTTLKAHDLLMALRLNLLE